MYKKRFINEAPESGNLLGTTKVKIPRAGAHAGQSGWQSNNAWDIPAPVGNPVYALADGVAQTFSDYGPKVKKTDGKKLFGQSFTVKSDGGLPNIYYTHLEGSPIRKGSRIKCGQFLGNIMDFPGSSYDHVHIGVESGDIRQFLNDDGSIKCAKNIKMGPTKFNPENEFSSITQMIKPTKPTSTSSKDLPVDTFLANTVTSMIKKMGLSESFGNDVVESYGTITIPFKSNPKIKSPVNGKVVKNRYVSGCQSQLTIKISENMGYLQFCGISNLSVNVGDSVNKGSLLGKTQSDVEVVFYDKNFKRLKLSDNTFNKLNNRITGKEDEDIKTKTKSPDERRYTDPVIGAIPELLGKMFSDKIDKKGNVERRWTSATAKQNVDPWIVNAVSKPFEKVGKILGTNKSQTESKKLKENIERIKKLLK